jgi:hypothetical protein
MHNELMQKTLRTEFDSLLRSSHICIVSVASSPHAAQPQHNEVLLHHLTARPQGTLKESSLTKSLKDSVVKKMEEQEETH